MHSPSFYQRELTGSRTSGGEIVVKFVGLGRVNSADLNLKEEKLGWLQTHQSICSCVALFNISRAQAAGIESVCCFVFVSVEFHHRFVCVCV